MFVPFLLACVAALVAYYLYLILAPHKQRPMGDEGQREGSMETIIEIDPIKVLDEMVTYQPRESAETPKNKLTEKSDDNRYSTPSPQFKSTCSGEQILVVTAEDISEGMSIVAGVNL